MISITAHADGCVLAVRAQPGAKRNAVVGTLGDSLKVAVTAPADQGKANNALVEVLGDFFGVKRSQVQLIAGAANRSKKFLLSGITVERARSKCAELAR